MKIFSIFLGFLLFLTIFTRTVSSHNEYFFDVPTGAQVSEAISKTAPLRFLPTHPLYFLIKIKEKITRFAKHSAAKRAQFDVIVSGKRLKEAYLLINSGKVKAANGSLRSYADTLDRMTRELEKARSQTQDIAAIVGEAAENLRLEETLFAAIYESWKIKEDQENFDVNFATAFVSFSKAVMTLDGIQPGIKDRFKSLIVEEKHAGEVQEEHSPSPIISSPSASPRKIIY